MNNKIKILNKEFKELDKKMDNTFEESSTAPVSAIWKIIDEVNEDIENYLAKTPAAERDVCDKIIKMLRRHFVLVEGNSQTDFQKMIELNHELDENLEIYPSILRIRYQGDPCCLVINLKYKEETNKRLVSSARIASVMARVEGEDIRKVLGDSICNVDEAFYGNPDWLRLAWANALWASGDMREVRGGHVIRENEEIYYAIMAGAPGCDQELCAEWCLYEESPRRIASGVSLDDEGHCQYTNTDKMELGLVRIL